MRTAVTIEGLRELDAALAELPRTIAKNATKRALAKAAEPIAEEAKRLVPVDSGLLRNSIAISTKLKNKVGRAEFSAVLRGGGSRAEAVAAMRDARRAAGAPSFAEIYIGPAWPKGFYGTFVEFGTSDTAAQPFMRPAWDSQKSTPCRSSRANSPRRSSPQPNACRSRNGTARTSNIGRRSAP